jgi:hypothetical protein
MILSEETLRYPEAYYCPSPLYVLKEKDNIILLDILVS